jgi:hypothetical protein
VLAPEIKALFRRQDRKLERELRRDKRKLFLALQELANIRPDKEGWAQFRKRWPQFFPEEDYAKVAQGSNPSVADYPYCIGQLWIGGYAPLLLMLGIDTVAYDVQALPPEEMWTASLKRISAEFDADWDEGVFRYQGSCDFQRALYLLFRESWRARICDKCGSKFIATRSAQKYCTTDCSEGMQRELKKKWWAEHGEKWRRQGKRPTKTKKGGTNVTPKAR